MPTVRSLHCTDIQCIVVGISGLAIAFHASTYLRMVSGRVNSEPSNPQGLVYAVPCLRELVAQAMSTYHNFSGTSSAVLLQATGDVVRVLKADEDVVNCIQVCDCL